MSLIVYSVVEMTTPTGKFLAPKNAEKYFKELAKQYPEKNFAILKTEKQKTEVIKTSRGV